MEKENVQSVINIFKNGVKKYNLEAYRNNEDCFIFSISDGVKRVFRQNFNIPLDEEILMCRDTSFWNNANQGVVVTDNALYCLPDNDNPEEFYIIKWSDIVNVKYQEEDIYFFINEEEYLPIYIGSFFKQGSVSEWNFVAAGKKLANLFDSIAASVDYVQTETIFDSINKHLENEEFELAQKKIIEHIQTLNKAEDLYCAYYALGNVYVTEAENFRNKADKTENEADKSLYIEQAVALDEKAIGMYDKALDNCDETTSDYCYICYCKANLILWDSVKARRLLIKSMESSDFEIASQSQELYNRTTKELLEKGYKDYSLEKTLSLEEKNNFQDLGIKERFCNAVDYRQRKFLLVVDTEKRIPGCYDTTDQIQCVFSLEKIPHDIKFPVGHPQANILYLGHPLIPTEYIPFEDATEILFLSKLREFCYLAQCLGAEEILIRRTKGTDMSNSIDKTLGGSVDVGRKFLGASAEFNNKVHEKRDEQKNDAMELVQHFQPTKYPFCPSDLIWFDTDDTWKNMVRQRLNGNLLSYREKITSSETIKLSGSQIIDVKAAFSNLLFKVSGTKNSSVEETFSKVEECEYVIDVKFKPVHEFTEDNGITNRKINNPVEIIYKEGKGFSQEESAFLEECKFCLEDDGIIDDTEKIFLMRKRVKLGLSEERALELMEMCLPKLTQEEQEYIELIKAIMVDNEIPSTAMRLINRERTVLNISEERAKELEAQCRNIAEN